MDGITILIILAIIIYCVYGAIVKWEGRQREDPPPAPPPASRRSPPTPQIRTESTTRCRPNGESSFPRIHDQTVVHTLNFAENPLNWPRCPSCHALNLVGKRRKIIRLNNGTFACKLCGIIR